MYLRGGHFTCVFIRYTRHPDSGQCHLRGSLMYSDPLHNSGVIFLDRIKIFLDWTFQYSTIPDYVGQWEVHQEGVHADIRQTKYLPLCRHPDEAQFIDCALYTYFSTLQTVADGSIRGFTPEGIHHTRTALAIQLIRDDLHTDIKY